MRAYSAVGFIQLLLIVLAESRASLQNNRYPGQSATCAGCAKEQDSKDPLYLNLAEESIKKYLEDNDVDVFYKVFDIIKVTKQIVAGVMYNIYFQAYPTNCNLNTSEEISDCEVKDTSTFLNCQSKIWEQPWLSSKKIEITCEPKGKEKRQVLGGVTVQDPADPVYKDLATESLNFYMTEKGLTETHEVINVTEATTQVVAGKITDLRFDARIGSNDIKCHSSIFEQAWLNVKNITITCDNENQENQEPEKKSSLPGGPVEKDVSDEKYIKLAEETFAKYQENISSTECHELIRIDKVTEQVVSGKLTNIEYEVWLISSDVTLKCRGEIWEQVWLDRKEIKVSCEESEL